MNNLPIDPKKIKVALVMVGVFLGVKLLAPQVFLANSPRVNPLFVSNLFNRQQAPASNVEVFSQIPQVSPPAGVVFQSVARGVKAAEDKKTNTIYFTVEQGTTFKVVETEITAADGTKKKVKLLIPVEK